MSRAFTAAIVSDHDSLRGSLQRYQTDKSEELIKAFVLTLTIHALAEQLVWHPELLRVFPGEQGQQLVAKEIQDHRQILDTLLQLKDLPETDETRPGLISSVLAKLTGHLNDEETSDLPNFESKISETESAALASKFKGTTASLTSTYSSAATLIATPFEKVQSLLASLPAVGSTNK